MTVTETHEAACRSLPGSAAPSARAARSSAAAQTGAGPAGLCDVTGAIVTSWGAQLPAKPSRS